MPILILIRILKLTNTMLEFMVLCPTWKNLPFFGYRLGATILNQTDNFSRALQKSALSAVEAHGLAHVLAVFRKV